MYKKFSILVCFCLFFVYAFSQQANASGEESTDFMRSNGKIFVVMAVTIVIVFGLFIYLINLDRKIKKLENNQTIKK